MAFDFTGGNNSTRISRTITSSPTAAEFSLGCWCRMDAWVTGRTFIGTGTTVAALSGLQSGTSTAQRFNLKVNCATTDMQVEVAAATTGVWICVVAVYNNSLTATNNLIYTGSQSSAMASQAHVVDTNGSGAVTGTTTGTIGKNAASNTTVDGRISQAFWVPWAMTLDEIERFRQGDWSVIWRGGTPRFFVPMLAGSAGLYDLAVPGNWTNNGSTALVEDPPVAFGWGTPSGLVAVRRGG